MIHIVNRLAAVSGLLYLTFTLTSAPAQDSSGADSAVHLLRVKGVVTIRHADDSAGASAALDTPLAAGDRIATGAKGQADIQIGESNVLHAGNNAEVRLDRVDAGQYRITLNKGGVAFHVAGKSTSDVEVATPSVAVRPAYPGVYSIAVKRSGESEIVPREGAVEVIAPLGSEWVHLGQKMVARGSARDPQYKIGPAVPLWRRVAFIVMNSVDLANAVASAGSSGEGEKKSTPTKSSSNGGTSTLPPRSGPEHPSSPRQ